MRQGPWLIGGSVLLGIAFGTLPYDILFPSAIFVGVGICLVLIRTFSFLLPHFVLIAFILFLAAFVYGQERIQSFTNLEPIRAEKEVYRVVSNPEEKGFYQEIIIRPVEQRAWWSRQKKVLWQAPLSVAVTPGERIRLSCDLVIPENFTPDFDYRFYLAKEGVGYLCKEHDFFVGEAADRVRYIYQLLSTPRTRLEHGIQVSLPEPESGLAKGLLLGGSDHLSGPIQDQFTNLGLTHIVAVSGYNIVLIVNALLALGLTLYLWRKQATALAFVGTSAFILMIGAPASAVRAGIMALAAFGAFIIGRVNYSLLALFLTAALMNLWNPLYLWYDAGFQLSFLATLAVIMAMRAVETKLSSRRLRRALQEIVWLSVWVYLFLLPILLFQFHTLTIFSIPANILFLPVVPFAMLGSFIASIAALLFPPATLLVGLIAYLPLTYILRGTYLLNQIPDITVPVHISLMTVGVWYISLLFAIIHIEQRRKQKQYEKNFCCPHSAHHY